MFTRFYSSIINNSTIITKLYQIWRLLNTHERGAGDWSRVSKGFHEVSCCHPIFRISLPNTVHRQYLVYDITEFMILVSSSFLQMLSFISFFYSFCSFLYGIPDIFQTQDKIHDVRSFSATLVPFFFFFIIFFFVLLPWFLEGRHRCSNHPAFPWTEKQTKIVETERKMTDFNIGLKEHKEYDVFLIWYFLFM